MNRRLATTLASAAFLAFVSVPAALSGAQQQGAQEGQQQEQATPRSGTKVTKEVQASCPVHPEIKTRTAGKCPKCRMQERTEKNAREKGKGRVRQQQQGNDTND
jgi:hypothetical protein